MTDVRNTKENRIVRDMEDVRLISLAAQSLRSFTCYSGPEIVPSVDEKSVTDDQTVTAN